MIELEKFTEAGRFELGSLGLFLMKFLALALWLGITTVLVTSYGFGKPALVMLLLCAAGAIAADSLAWGGLMKREFASAGF